MQVMDAQVHCYHGNTHVPICMILLGHMLWMMEVFEALVLGLAFPGILDSPPCDVLPPPQDEATE